MSRASESDTLTVVRSSPESSPAPETPTKQPADRDDEDQLFRHFRGWAWSQRSRDTLFWVWQFGFDIEKETERRWVCKACVRKKNAERHLWDHHQIQDPSGKRTAPSSRKKPLKSYRTITQAWNLDPTKPRDQAIANSFIKKFDRTVFQRMLVESLVESNISFREP
ncbi:hAT family dimerization domain protein [Verticillium dahliae]